MANFAKCCKAGAMSRTELNTGTSPRAELQGLDATNVEATNQATLSPISPNEVSNHDNDAKPEGKDADEINEIDKMLERVEELEEQFEREGEEADVKVVKDVDTPTQEQIKRHEATHTPYRRWCKECNKGLAIRDKHGRKKRRKNKNVPDTETLETGQTKYSIDYMTMDSVDEGKAPASMVMVNHEDGGIFAYGTVGKGIQGDKYWLAKRIAKDIDNCGTKTAKIQIKPDQEPAIVNLQEEVRELRRGRTICTNSPVGESECNGRAENAVRQVQVKVRTFRAAIETKMKEKLDMSRPFTTWLIRWAGEVLTKYSVGSDSKTPWQRRRGEACDKPIVPIGETVLYLPLKTAEIHAS
jgi:hypothetical protein